MNGPIRVDHKQRSLAHPVAVAIYAILACYSSLGLEVRQERKVELPIPGESRMAPCAVHRDADELSAQILELGKNFVIERHLVATDRAPVSRIKCEHHRLSKEFAQSQPLVRRAPEGEVRGCGARGQR
jgi:hypothetical protein